jgi:lactoylglutathione lyase
MKFSWCTLNVKNLEESLKFYTEIVGLKVTRRFNAGPGSEIAFVGDEGSEIELMYHGGDREVNIGKDISLGFEVKSVDEMLAFVEKKGLSHTEVFSPNSHIKFFFVTDPNGLRIQFAENM